MKHAPLFCIIYDSIYNSVFSGQVLKPLIDLKQKNPLQKIILVSFEKVLPSTQDINRLVPSATGIDLIILKKIPFIGSLSIRFAAWQLKRTVLYYKQYQLHARGPLAGAICLHAVQPATCTAYTMQARGLLGAEYAYEHQQAQGIKKWWHKFRAWQYYQLEAATFGTAHKKYKKIVIEAVSPALKDYLIVHYQVPEEHIIIAHHDIPIPLSHAKRTLWRNTIRTQLNIAQDRHVYCYNGSGKSWQCPQETIHFFKQEYEKNNQNFLLILSQDKDIFLSLAQKYQLAENTYHIMQVAHHDVMPYLSACDTGILWRKPHIVNWISRPTKALEYQAAGLKIAHNNTIAWLSKQ
jgi:hypothetical protein